MSEHHEFERLLAAAIGLVHTRASEASKSVQIGSTQFRLIAERAEEHGWIIVLLQEHVESVVVRDCLKSRFGLTERESEVARLLADRYSNQEIADALGISGFTAERHTERILRKLGVASRRDVRGRLNEASAA
jgi:DNA-binding CsgD family transcriptional regulator